MRWRKRGLIFCPDGDLSWAVSHAALPVPVFLGGGIHRIFFSARDAQKRSHVGYVDVELEPAPRILQIGLEAVLSPGAPGRFDDSGIGMGCIVTAEREQRLYYMGWNLEGAAPWRNSIGLAVGEAHTPRFVSPSPVPAMGLSAADPHTLSYPWVLRDGQGWRMWYGSHLAWNVQNHDMQHVIKTATSDDGIAWNRDGAIAVGLDDQGTYALARPCVIQDPGLFRMWYAYRGERYLIGYAESPDGLAWTRRDGDVGIAPSESGWDSEMICYPCVFDHAGQRYMLYNGNGYGRTGFGLAVLE